jgi:hypothetical protein
MVSIKTPIYFFEAIILDILAIPGLFMTKRSNARWHLHVICPLCSEWRKSFRCNAGNKECIWHEAWVNNGYQFHRSFGVKNWVKYYLGIKGDLKKYDKEFKRMKKEWKKVRKEK